MTNIKKNVYTVQVKPGSKKGPLVESNCCLNGNDTNVDLVVFLQAKAIDGAANKQLIEVLAKHFKTAKKNISLLRGTKSRIKHISINEL